MPDRKRCLYIVPEYGWRGETIDRAMGRVLRDSEREHIGDTCGWAEAHIESLEKMPKWLRDEAVGAMAWRPRHCADCACYEPE